MPVSTKTFRPHLMHTIKRILESEDCRYTDNTLQYFTCPSGEIREREAAWLRGHPAPSFSEFIDRNADNIAFHVQTKEALYGLLEDDASRETLVAVAAYFLLGHRYVKFPYYAPGSIEERVRLERESLREETDEARKAVMATAALQVGYTPKLYEVSFQGTAFNVCTGPVFLYNLAHYNDYHYDGTEPPVTVEPGDCVLDCGACLGDTALYFAAGAGAGGHVLAFEPNPDMLAAAFCNKELNPHLRDRITLIGAATSNTRGVLPLKLSGAASALVEEGAEGQVPTSEVPVTTIDTEVRRRRLPCVDFIKMDVEGAELHSLIGAHESITRFRPKLAISIYHGLLDYINIPKYIDSLGLGYKFYLKHHFMNAWETILYARVE